MGVGRFAVACVICASGCGFGAPGGSATDGVSVDGGTDAAMIDAPGDGAMTLDGPDAPGGTPDGCASFSTVVNTCTLPMAPGGNFAITGSIELDTDDASTDLGGGQTTSPQVVMPFTTLQGTEVLLVVVNDLTFQVNAELHGSGNKPLVVIAYGNVTMAGNSKVDLAAGGAGRQPSCASGATMNGASGSSGGGGGGGGGFGGAGAQGGAGAGGLLAGGAGGPLFDVGLSKLVGGCPGGRGGNGQGDEGHPDGGSGGKGGGAFYLGAGGSLTMAGGAFIDVGGEGGDGAEAQGGNAGNAGGGGGGSGGLLWIEASSIVGAGRLVSNGGGGGGGGDLGSSGGNGDDAHHDATPADGGSAPVTGGVGGPGGYSTIVPFIGAGAADGAGGGGGGVGVIRIHVRSGTTPQFAVASPPPTFQ